MLISKFREKPLIINIEMKSINHTFINGRKRNRKYSAGYCDCELHRGCLDEKQIVQHECYEKECPYFFIIIDDYYADRKKLHKEIEKEKKRIIAEEKLIVEQCNLLIENDDGMRIISAKKKSNEMWILEYITVCSVDIMKLEQKIVEKIGAVRMIRKECDFETSMMLFMAS